AAARVEGAEGPVVNRGADEQQSARRQQWPTVVLAAGVGQAARRELREFAEGNAPQVSAGGEFDGIQCAPGHADGGIPFRLQPAAVTGEAVRLVRRRVVRFAGGQVFAVV